MTSETTKAYNNLEFLSSPEARTIRMLSEYIHPIKTFAENKIEGTIVFFGSARIPSPEDTESNPKFDSMRRYYDEARELAKRLTLWVNENTVISGVKKFVVCTGGGPGIMEAANRGAHDANGESIGLNISLPFEQSPNPYITTELNFEFHYFFMRKFIFSIFANALVIFPGGYGTIDELMELLTLIQTGKSDRPIPVILYGTDYWDQIINLDKLVEFGMIAKEDLDMLFRANDVDSAFYHLTSELTRIHIKT